MHAVIETVTVEPVSGIEIFAPLAKLKKSPRNVRKVPRRKGLVKSSMLEVAVADLGVLGNAGDQNIVSPGCSRHVSSAP